LKLKAGGEGRSGIKGGQLLIEMQDGVFTSQGDVLTTSVLGGAIGCGFQCRPVVLSETRDVAVAAVALGMDEGKGDLSAIGRSRRVGGWWGEGESLGGTWRRRRRGVLVVGVDLVFHVGHNGWFNYKRRVRRSSK
jgi:hypothetical protein